MLFMASGAGNFFRWENGSRYNAYARNFPVVRLFIYQFILKAVHYNGIGKNLAIAEYDWEIVDEYTNNPNSNILDTPFPKTTGFQAKSNGKYIGSSKIPSKCQWLFALKF